MYVWNSRIQGIGNAIKKKKKKNPVLAGLNNLEYRGYDSAGIAFFVQT